MEATICSVRVPEGTFYRSSGANIVLNITRRISRTGESELI